MLFDLKLVIEFPPGTSILLPSGSVRHGNTLIGAHEFRTSVTQYCPGGLLRYVAYGMRTVKQLKNNPEVDELEVIGDLDKRWAEVVGCFSHSEELHADRLAYSNAACGDS